MFWRKLCSVTDANLYRFAANIQQYFDTGRRNFLQWRWCSCGMKTPSGKRCLVCVALVGFLFLPWGVRIQPSRCLMMCLLLSWEGMIILRLNFVNQLPLPCTTQGFAGHIVRGHRFPPVRRCSCGTVLPHRRTCVFTPTKLDLHQTRPSSVAVHLVVHAQNGLINHYALVCKHSLTLIAGIKQNQ